jgi:hypothetical protein
MTAHELMVRTNHYLIKGGELTEAHKTNITGQLLAAKSTPEQARRRFTKITGGERQMYPFLYVLPYNGGAKLNTIFNQQPQTQILSMNMYELEIIRLLYLFAPDSPEVQDMVGQVLERLKKTCFGNHGCGTGECYDAGLVTLRFLSAAAPEKQTWISDQIKSYNKHIAEKKRSKYYGRQYSNYYMWYYWLCLSELPFDIAEPEILRNKNDMLLSAGKSMAMGIDEDKMINPIRMYALRNSLSRLPEYAHIKEKQPYVAERDGRLYFDIS